MTDSQGAALPAFTEHRVPHAAGALHVRDFPGSKLASVLLHGFPDNSHINDNLIPHLVAASPAFGPMNDQLFGKIAVNTARLSDFQAL